MLFDAQSVVEVDEIRAAAEQHVLAVVHDLAGGGQLVGGSASTEVGATLEELDEEAGVGESTAGS